MQNPNKSLKRCKIPNKSKTYDYFFNDNAFKIHGYECFFPSKRILATYNQNIQYGPLGITV